MQNKIILVVCGIVVIIAIVFLAFYVLKDNSFDNTVDNHVSAALVQPEVELSIEPESVTNKKVTIFVKASVSQGKIESITLPNGKVENSANVEYKVSENGEYNFIVATEAGINVTKSITVNNISDVSADKPYIPEGFSHVKGTKVETGYIIEDSNGNEYVWVPVKTGKLTRNTIDNDQYEEIDDSVTDFYNSVSKYYGFYIARYEASKKVLDNGVVPASVGGVMPWANVNYEEAYEVCKNSASIYGYTDVNTSIINSYAWDTTLEWIDENVKSYSSNTSYGNYSGTIARTGATQLDQANSICDLAGNLREWSTEVFYPELAPDEEDSENTENQTEETEENNEVNESVIEENFSNYRVVRGGSANINKVANSHTGNPETMEDPFWGFRVILYKD